MRTIIIGDIHGCSGELERLLEAVSYSAHDRLILLGDNVDRGYDSAGVIRLISSLCNTNENVHLLYGNHEWTKRNTDSSWFNSSCGKFKMYYEEDQFICVHAGWSSIPEERTERLMLEDRSIICGYPKIRNFGIPIALKDIKYFPKPRRYDGKLFISGHTPVLDVCLVDEFGRLQIVEDGMPIPKKGAIFCDTGCYMGARLSAVIVENEKLFKKSVCYSGR